MVQIVEEDIKYSKVEKTEDEIESEIQLKVKEIIISEDKKHDIKIPSFEDNATPFQRLFLTYLDPLIKLGSKKTLILSDLGNTSVQDQSAVLYSKFYKHWDEESKLPSVKQSLWRVLWKTVGYARLAKALGLYCCFALLAYGPVLILNALVKHLEKSAILSNTTLVIYVALMLLIPSLASLCCAQSNIILAHMGVQFRNSLINAIYRKSLKLSPASRQLQSTGMIVNMFSNDTSQLQRFLFFINNASIAPLQIAVSLYLIYQQVNVSTFVGLGFMFVLMPMNGVIFAALNKFRKLKVSVTDTRVKLMNEMLSGIRVIKSYAWEDAFENKVDVIRDKELYLLKKLAYIIAIGFTLIMFSAPIIQPILIFFVYVKLGNELDAATAFTTIALFNLMQMPFAFLPMGLAQYVQSLVSTNRMLNFFMSEELEPYVDHSLDPADEKSVIKFVNVDLCWVKEENLTTEDISLINNENNDNKGVEMTIKKGNDYESVSNIDGEKNLEKEIINRSCNSIINANINVKKGQLVCIVGAVGSGKSSMLSGILGEMHLKSGQLRVHGSIAYCDQRPWILNATVKENILFGLPYDEEKFEKTLQACNLHDDINVLPGGIMTEIGEKGINLSGGQKVLIFSIQYINLYRYLFNINIFYNDIFLLYFSHTDILFVVFFYDTRLELHLLDQSTVIMIFIY
jgi:ATP-binding cassette subfamily C (CFTR/MRP) protein 1